MSSNWYLLWALNGNRMPDEIKDPNQIPAHAVDGLLLGLTYSTQPHDNLLELAQRFRTTIKSLLLTNPEMTDKSVLSVGENLCIIPCNYIV
ncbi:hypothetical protein GUITHDRAFT_151397 [Guillardia theta CCMP2712]|uniref:LysM domain-containing protein n=1 Tax=Guillardia theta (strain CCMP2712) TaxID=905079 RepID=L1JMV1_GUITC|nr:hypothetical protein GUITHDRAFT_151397 [Guillardia theta CCMP2712]EKX49525.1 hypothetical protein GUITHDRAFT_151397 [Guillardia theta CCMP2712]|mmetsp:Transcript_52677/g.163468  ORF Transcript_52677/g.163468 Transcript_52677/m.163468 type:complete len:91 (-) Transcript_52677:25-297(-)|eukprot:XP_005836505.1 hypothetical protein GUITHDRAFT_151397 [Guillardia theta CCMP2712]